MAEHRYEKYRGLRALLLTRVSTAEQAKRYSHAAQERVVKEKLINPLGLQLVDTINDTYSGLEYRYRQTLGDILRMAEEQQFDVLVMDVLDRGLGRRALVRELYQMQLKELGIPILTTDPEDHEDDDSLVGQVMRFFRGYKAEEEVADTVRRTQNGKMEKALGNPEQGIPQQLIGTGFRRYGYEFTRNEKGRQSGFKLKLDIVYVEADGTEWTEVKVVVFIFESAANGISTHQIALLLNEKGIPSPAVTKGRRYIGMREYPMWQNNTIGKMIKDSVYYGEFRQNRTALVGRVPGHKAPVRRKTSEDEQIVIPVPAIVTKELFERANRRVAQNKQLATRNNQYSKESLLRGGFAKCAYCGCSLRVFPQMYTYASGEEVVYFYYNCTKPILKDGKCSGCSIPVDTLDDATTEYIFEKIRDPSEIDNTIAQLLADNPIVKQRERNQKNLTEIRTRQTNLRNNFNQLMQEGNVDKGTRDYFTVQLQFLAKEEQDAQRELNDENAFQKKYYKLQERIAAFHLQCETWRKQLDDPEFTPAFAFKREALLFFGISVTVRRIGEKPRHDFHTDPCQIVELLLERRVQPGQAPS